MNIKNQTNASYVGKGLSLLSTRDVLKDLKNSKVFKKTALYSVVAAMLLSFTGCKSNEDVQATADDLTYDEIITAILNDEDIKLIPDTNIAKVALNASESEIQKTVLNSVMDYLADYNIRYGYEKSEVVNINGDKYLIQPALKWEEVMAMSLFYNNFSKDEIAQITNGETLSAYKLSQDYNMAMLQLMGAHVIETKNSQVRTDLLLQSKEAKEFYNKYHDMFLKCKTTDGDEQLRAVERFYEELFKDFPINEEQREIGIAHSDPRALLDNYKFSIVPMVAASEMMFQNLEYDHTLSQKAIDFFNDIGACNMADDLFEKVEMISMFTDKNDKYANYELIRQYVNDYLIDMKSYVKSDLHRDLMYLESFQEAVNGLYDSFYTTIYGSTYTVTEYYTTTTRTETTDRDKAVDASSEEEVSRAEKEAQDKIDRENAQAKEDAEKEADKIAGEMQTEEDKKREDLEAEADKNNKDTEDKIDDANENINSGGTVNEEDLGPNIEIDPEYVDENGNIIGSVGEITTDGDGANQDLPDPNGSETLPDPNAMSYQESSDYTVASASFTTEDEIDKYIELLANVDINKDKEPQKVYSL